MTSQEERWKAVIEKYNEVCEGKITSAEMERFIEGLPIMTIVESEDMQCMLAIARVVEAGRDGGPHG